MPNVPPSKDLPLDLLSPPFVGQLIYSSFPQRGFRLCKSANISPMIKATLIEEIVHAYWDAYNPPALDYQAVFIHQISEQQTLFGWLRNHGRDDMGRENTPYCLSYYLERPLEINLLATIRACLAHGPLPAVPHGYSEEPLPTPLLLDVYQYDYEPDFRGTVIPTQIYQACLTAIGQNHLVRCFLAATATGNCQESVA